MNQYITAQGDMWDSIAYTQLGSTDYTDRLINLNTQYRDYYIFPAGITLELPEVAAKPPNTAPPWRKP